MSSTLDKTKVLAKIEHIGRLRPNNEFLVCNGLQVITASRLLKSRPSSSNNIRINSWNKTFNTRDTDSVLFLKKYVALNREETVSTRINRTFFPKMSIKSRNKEKEYACQVQKGK